MRNYPKIINRETVGNGARYFTPEEGQVVALHYGEEFAVDTGRGYHRHYYPGSDYASQAERGDAPFTGEPNRVWINQCGTMLCSGDHPNKGKIFLVIIPEETVLYFEGKYYVAVRTPNDNLRFKKVRVKRRPARRVA